MARIILKSDFDGVVGAMLLRSVIAIDEILFAHPEDVWSGEIVLNETDYVLNLPILSDVARHFTGHRYPSDTVASNVEGLGFCCTQQILRSFPKLGQNKDVMTWVKTVMDFNTGNFDLEALKNPNPYLQIGILMDPLTGMGKRKDFLKSNYYFLLDFIECGLKRPIEEWLEELDLQDRINCYTQEQSQYLDFLTNHAKTQGPIVIVDKRVVELVPLGNRYKVFELFHSPYAIYLYWGKEKNAVVLTGVVSPFRGGEHNLGDVFSAFGGYGDEGYGTMQLPENKLTETLERLIAMLH